MKRTRDLIFAAGFCLLLALTAALTLLHDTGDTLFYENRYKADLPVFTGSSLTDGSYFEGLESYLTDRAPLRTTLLAAQTRVEMDLLRRPSVNGVVVTDDTLLAYKDYETWALDDYIPTRAGWIAGDQRALQDLIESYGGSYFYLGLPEQFSYFSEEYPAYMNNRQWYLAPTTAVFKAAMAAQGVDFIDMAPVFDVLGHPGDLYYRSDHHFRFAGALVCYHTLMDEIRRKTGYELPELVEGENLQLVTVENAFLGAYNKKLYDLWETDEKLVVGEPVTPLSFTREDEGAEAEPRVLSLPENTDEFVGYDVYMGGDFAETVIRTNRPELPSILVYGDSYTNALETLLYWSFDEMRSIDLRYYDDMTLAEYIERWQPDIVVCVRDDSEYCELSGNGNPLGVTH
jgi:hypothetical protein